MGVEVVHEEAQVAPEQVVILGTLLVHVYLVLDVPAGLAEQLSVSFKCKVAIMIYPRIYL